MNTSSTPHNAADCPTKCGSEKDITQVKGCNERLYPATTNKEEAGRQSDRTTSTSGPTSCSHRRRWSTDCCHSNGSPIITLKKNTKEPQPPQRGVSLLRCRSHCPGQRYSSPITGIGSATHLPTSASSSPVRTSVITGHDPLGWKLRPKSSISSKRAHTHRLSLQIPLPVIVPDPVLSDKSPPYPVQKTPPRFKGKQFRRHHSDSLAFLRSTPAVTLEELREVRLRPAQVDDVLSEAHGEEKASPRKTPPAVPEKSPLTRKIAQLIAHSWQRPTCAPHKTEQEEIIYSVIKPKAKTQQAENHCGLYAKINEMHLKSDE
ncbi:uncharacterized protein LOC109512065 [Hippocampus comes]|uniref:uncharacterized protein LOC109512065 n=1 Tax=Hippocampus comes TaxID=109280 RepID=UPI00094EB4AB|nr:PREDICTED: uncharacterized protein LOC109512065 [Hippocampus comes]XP_019719109.1 PREDICTED: uncharacterized protein LOC109512065 [Hippocampus comes]